MGPFHLRAPPPSQHLKKILRNYPEGSQVFKEALQNADDAGATTFAVLLDERHLYCGEEMKRFLGPSLVLYNNGLFTDKDWKSLQCMFESSKSETLGKIGRFGMGSRSYFHLADVLFVLSGSKFAFLDPDWALSAEGGRMFDLNDPHEEFRALYAPLPGLFGLQAGDKYFNGTLIRLPLRMGKFARQSTFAPYEYTVPKTLKILSRFKQEVAECLLFLQSVHTAELWTWPDHEERPSRYCSVQLSSRSIDSCTPCVSSFESDEEWSTKSTLPPVKPASHTSPLSILLQAVRESVGSRNPQWIEEVIRGDTGSLPAVERRITLELLHFDRDFMYGAEPVKTERQFWVQCIQVVTDPVLSVILRQQKKDAMLPVIGVAFFENAAADFEGRAFSFLPLPDVSTGLPVHVHGSFYLTDNRRSLWAGSKDTDGQAQLWIKWNEALIRCMAPAFARILTLTKNSTYKCWPDPLKLDPRFRPLLVPLVREIVLAECVLGNSGLRWSPEECRFLVLSETDMDVISSVELETGELIAQITKECQQSGQHVMHVPEHVQRLLVLLDEVEKIQGAQGDEAPKKRHFNSISLLDVFHNCLLPDWRARNVHSLTMLPCYTALMFVLCKTLSRVGERHIQRFKPLCEDLPFLPVANSAEDTHVRLLTPQEAYDPGLQGFAIAKRMMPAGEFRTADVLKVLRRWGMKTALYWPDLAREAFSRIAFIGDQLCGG